VAPRTGQGTEERAPGTEERAPGAAPDQEARDRVATDLTATLFVEAGAGSGKTTSLVGRFVALVEAGVPADHIAAITFTEQAARELADRTRRRLARGGPTCAAALEVIDRAAICTLHAFAQRILSEHAIEAGLPPRFSVLDEIESDDVFDRRWEEMVERLLEDPALEMPVRVIAACGRSLDDLRELALQFRDNWDRLDAEPCDEELDVDVAGLGARLDHAIAHGDLCVDGDDKLLAALQRLAGYRRRLARAVAPDELVELLRETSAFSVGKVGKKASWSGCTPADVQALVKAADAERERLVGLAVSAALRHLGSHIATFTLAGVEQRRREGTLEFHDLLVLARALLRDPEHGWPVRQALAARYQRLLLDEFQDTDPIQVELAMLIASDDPTAGGREWERAEPRPGALFFVGDPKQSIYRFRRADITTFMDVRSTPEVEVERLTANFRSGALLVEWVNATFANLIVEQPGRQPAYIALDPERTDAPSGPPVALLGDGPVPDAQAPVLRAAEAQAVADAVTRVIAEGWSVQDEAGWRPARASDVCILVPARTSLPFLERALAAAGVAYRAETSSLVYATREVRDLLAVARAIDDPTDQLALLTALRTVAFGCGDDDLYEWRVRGGHWDHQARRPDDVDERHPVATAMAWLGAMHRARTWMTASDVLDTVVRERRLLEVAFAGSRPQDLLRRVRFVVDQARAWEDAAGGSLRDYLGWVARQSAPTSRVVETVLPETDEASVRIMTVHAAKGLEFPVVVLSGMTSRPARRGTGVRVLWDGGRWQAKLAKGVATEQFEDAVPLDEAMDDDERRRLLYVAATRARDHLLVSVFRSDRGGTDRTLAELVRAAAPVDGPYYEGGPAPPVAAAPPVARPTQAAPPPLLDPASWEAERTGAVSSAARRLTMSATCLAEEVAARRAGGAADDPGLAKDAPDLELPAWQKGRYGTAIGRAVHAVLQTVDLATGAGLLDAAAAQAAAEEVLGRELLIAALATSALESEVVRDAASRPHWRELYVGAPVGGAVLEGYIDLLVRAEDGMVIVDYKTDAVRDDADLAVKVARYRPQLAAYAAATEAATGERVVRGVLLFLATTGARAVAVPALAEAVVEVGAEMGTG
jgi:ATP-dependent exoDNAse (exonuclease V) beta subunit